MYIWSPPGLLPKLDTWTRVPAPGIVVAVPDVVVVVRDVGVVPDVVVVVPDVVVVVPDVGVVPDVVVVVLPPLALHVSEGALLVPFQEPRPPKLVVAPAAMEPL
jgi:hypothetical protein